MRQKIYKNTVELSFGWLWGLTLSMVNIPRKTPLEKSNFSFVSSYQLLGGGGKLCPLPPSACGSCVPYPPQPGVPIRLQGSQVDRARVRSCLKRKKENFTKRNIERFKKSKWVRESP